MNQKILATAIVIATIGIFTDVNAQEPINKPETSTQVIDACIQNRAETLRVVMRKAPVIYAGDISE